VNWESEITRVGVVGCGVMGAGIAELCARAGRDVRVVVSRRRSVPAARDRVAGSLHRRLRRGRIGQADYDAALGRLSFTDDLTALADRELIFEAVPEDPETKTCVLAALGSVLGDCDNRDTVIATNTSSIPIVKLARASGRPSHVVGTHFFNPVSRMRLVEVVESTLTDPRASQRAAGFVTSALGKHVVHVRDRAGFVVNALLVPYLLAAIRMVESGFAPPSDVDTAMELGCSHPMGPLKLIDLVGLDVIAAIAETLHAEFREAHYAPPPLLLRMVDSGLLGAKAGRGFSEYAAGNVEEVPA
jgi:3-hydroxybutyryl-CoA dehydrogenase